MWSPLRRLGREEDGSELAMVLGGGMGLASVTIWGCWPGGNAGEDATGYAWQLGGRESTCDRLDEGSCRQLLLVKDVGQVWPVYLRFLGVRVS